jgi:bacterioferritin
MVKMNELVNLLLESINNEWKAALQYQIQSAQIKGLYQDPISEHLMDHGSDETNHAVRLTKHLLARGVDISVVLPQFTVSGDVTQMLKQSLKDEITTIDRYRKIVELCENNKELIDTKILVEDIIVDEIEHEDELATMLKAKIRSKGESFQTGNNFTLQ